MRDINWWAVAGFGLVGLAMILGIAAVWVTDPALANNLGGTATILGTPGAVILLIIAIRKIDEGW